jgi:hypothetical protein
MTTSIHCVGFIVHGRPIATDPNIKYTDAERFFIPLATLELYVGLPL